MSVQDWVNAPSVAAEGATFAHEAFLIPAPPARNAQEPTEGALLLWRLGEAQFALASGNSAEAPAPPEPLSRTLLAYLLRYRLQMPASIVNPLEHIYGVRFA
jgi:hypothetical protein